MIHVLRSFPLHIVALMTAAMETLFGLVTAAFGLSGLGIIGTNGGGRFAGVLMEMGLRFEWGVILTTLGFLTSALAFWAIWQALTHPGQVELRMDIWLHKVRWMVSIANAIFWFVVTSMVAITPELWIISALVYLSPVAFVAGCVDCGLNRIVVLSLDPQHETPDLHY